MKEVVIRAGDDDARLNGVEVGDGGIANCQFRRWGMGVTCRFHDLTHSFFAMLFLALKLFQQGAVMQPCPFAHTSYFRAVAVPDTTLHAIDNDTDRKDSSFGLARDYHDEQRLPCG